MGKGRLEAFSDGVLAIILTIMVLELRVPHAHADLEALRPLIPVFASYVPSFVNLGIYWNNQLAYLAAIPLAFLSQWLAGALYVGVALTWLIPDTRIARALAQRDASGDPR